MTRLKVLVAPDPRLNIIAKPVASINDDVRLHLNNMLETMYAEDGVGLAATQVGLDMRMIVIDLSHNDEKMTPLKMINPEIVWVSDHNQTFAEGCLSVPEHYVDVARPAEVTVKYFNENGEEKEIHGKDYLAACLQHEMDHLDGILFLDHISSLKRSMILRKLLKQKRR